MRRMKALLPLVVGVLVCFCIRGASAFASRSFLSILPWTDSVRLKSVCRLLQCLLCSYLFFLALEVLRESPMARRVLAAAGLALLCEIACLLLVALVALPGIPDALAYLVPCIQVILLAWVALTYGRECVGSR